jgi:hypothetical protein
MAFTEALRLVIDADSSGAVRGIQQVGRTADRELGRSKKTLDQWGNQLTAVGAGLIGVGSAALFGLGKAAMAAEEAGLSVVKLENTLQNMPQLAGESSDQFIDLAQSIQDVTAADADAIVEAEALLGTFQLTADEIKKITPLVVDYSRKFGVDLPTAAVQVGKALDGNIGALRRVGISIDETAFAADRFSAVQSALADQVGGFAQAEGATFAGSLQRLKNQLGDVAEGVGVGAVDAFSSMFGVVEGLIDRFQDLSPATQSAIGKFATFGSVGLIAAGGISIVIGQTLKAVENFKALGTAAQAAGSRIGAFRGNILVAGASLTGLVVGLELIDRAFPTSTANVSKLENALLKLGSTGDITGELSDKMGDDLGKLRDAIAEVADPGLAESATHSLDSVLTVGGLLPGGTGNLDQARQTIDDVDKSLASLAGRDPEAASAAVEALTAALAEQGISSSTVLALLDDYSSTLAGIDTATATSGVDALGNELGDQAVAAEEAKAAIDAYATAVAAQFDPLLGFAAAEQSLNDALVRQAEVYANAESTAWEKAAADQAVTSALIGLDTAANELNTEIASGNLTLADARSRLIDMAVAAGVSQSEAVRLADQLLHTTTRARDLGNTDPNVDISETGGSRTLGTLSSVQQQAINTGRQKPNVRVTATDNASATLGWIGRQIFGLPSSKNISVNVAVSGMAALNIAKNKLLGFHTGGIVPGPRGQEVAAILQAGERVISLPEMDAMDRGMMPGPSGGGGGVNVYLTIDNRGSLNPNSPEIARLVTSGLAKAGQMGMPITIRGRSL